MLEPQEGSFVNSTRGRFAVWLKAFLVAAFGVDLFGVWVALAGYAERPTGPISTIIEILESYGIGNDAGGFRFAPTAEKCGFEPAPS